MRRKEFLHKIIRYTLLLLLGILAVALGRKAVPGNICSSCPGKGICNGETDCAKY
jgi:hypothetical protein